MSADEEGKETETKNDAGQATPDKAGDNTQGNNGAGNHDPVARNTKIIGSIVAFLFVWYVAADRYAPWTDQARVQGFVVPISPKVSGILKM